MGVAARSASCGELWCRHVDSEQGLRLWWNVKMAVHSCGEKSKTKGEEVKKEEDWAEKKGSVLVDVGHGPCGPGVSSTTVERRSLCIPRPRVQQEWGSLISEKREATVNSHSSGEADPTRKLTKNDSFSRTAILPIVKHIPPPRPNHPIHTPHNRGRLPGVGTPPTPPAPPNSPTAGYLSAPS